MNVAYRLFVSLILILPSLTHAIDEYEVPEKKQTVFGLYLTAEEAFKLKSNKEQAILFIDVRTRAEMKFVGAPELMDANIPIRFMHPEYLWSDKSSTYRTLVNKHFVEDVEKLHTQLKLDKTTPVILICQAGARVPRAAKKLYDAGFEKVYSVFEGFEGSKAKTGEHKGKRVVNGWKNAQLPWSYKLEKSTMYFNFDSSKSSTSY